MASTDSASAPRNPAHWWVPAAGLALGAIAVATGRVTAAHLWLLSFFCLGMPHGTLDVWRGWAWLRQRARPYFAALLFWVGYLGLAGAFYGLWQLLPWLALGVFLALTVWHWGTAEAQWLRLRSGEREALAVARGVWVLALPVALDGPGCLRILGEMLAVGGTGANLETLAETLAFPWAIGAVGVVAWSVDMAVLVHRRLWASTVEIFVLAALAALLPGPAFIALFFIFVHSWRYLRWAFTTTELARGAKAAFGTYWQVLGLTLAGIVPWWLALDQPLAVWNDGSRAIALYLVVISCLTVPHALFIEILDGRLRFLLGFASPSTPAHLQKAGRGF